jgi:hypothetical protein
MLIDGHSLAKVVILVNNGGIVNKRLNFLSEEKLFSNKHSFGKPLK